MNKIAQNEKVEKLYDDLFTKYFPPSKMKSANVYYFVDRMGGEKNIKLKIIQLLNDGLKIRCGYFATSIRGVHDGFIMVKN